MGKDEKLDQPSDADRSDDLTEGEVVRRERRVLDDRARVLHGARQIPTAPPAGLSEQELSRRLLYDLINSQARTESMLQTACDLFEPHTQELIRANQLRRAELAQKERALALEAKAAERTEAADVRRFGIVERAFGGIGVIFGVMFKDSRVNAAVAAAITTLVTSLLAQWGLGSFDTLPPGGP